ncbi:hypothetical protein V8D89_008572 [Ganoderma adspersum]
MLTRRWDSQHWPSLYLPEQFESIGARLPIMNTIGSKIMRDVLHIHRHSKTAVSLPAFAVCSRASRLGTPTFGVRQHYRVLKFDQGIPKGSTSRRGGCQQEKQRRTRSPDPELPARRFAICDAGTALYPANTHQQRSPAGALALVRRVLSEGPGAVAADRRARGETLIAIVRLEGRLVASGTYHSPRKFGGSQKQRTHRVHSNSASHQKHQSRTRWESKGGEADADTEAGLFSLWLSGHGRAKPWTRFLMLRTAGRRPMCSASGERDVDTRLDVAILGELAAAEGRKSPQLKYEETQVGFSRLALYSPFLLSDMGKRTHRRV